MALKLTLALMVVMAVIVADVQGIFECEYPCHGRFCTESYDSCEFYIPHGQCKCFIDKNGNGQIDAGERKTVALQSNGNA